AYEATPPQPWQLRSIFVADNTPDTAGDFPAMSEAVITADIPDYFTAQRLYLDDYSDNQAVTDEIVQALNDPGALFLNYVGHASIGMWANEQIFSVDDIQNLQNEPHLPVVLSMTCLDGYWIYPNQSVAWQSGPSLAEELVRHAAVGAVATFSPTGLGVATGHDLLHHGFYRALFQDETWKLGPATLAAKLNLYSQDTHHEYNDLLHTYTVFGDPALFILGPYNLQADAEPALVSVDPGETLNISMQIHNIGEMTDTYAISADGSGWSVSHPNSAGPLDPAEVFTATISVQVPEQALQGERHTVLLQVQSQGLPSRSAQLNLTAVIGPLKAYLPFMNR
ncbi:MAG: C25 family cysteine peptidase, partial [Anaerolineales bacterium]